MKNIDVIGIVALAFFLEKTENYKKALEFFEKQKIQTIESKNIDKKYYNTTAPVEERIKDCRFVKHMSHFTTNYCSINTFCDLQALHPNKL